MHTLLSIVIPSEDLSVNESENIRIELMVTADVALAAGRRLSDWIM